MTATIKKPSRKQRRVAKKAAARAKASNPETRGDAPVQLEAPQGTKSKVPQVIVLLGLIAAGVIAFLLIYTSGVQRQPALVVANDIPRGQLVTADDLRLEYFSGDSGFAHLTDQQAALVVGQVATHQLLAGELITTNDVAQALDVALGEVVVGLSLDPGGYPTALTRGDRVDLYITAGPDSNAEMGSLTPIVESAEVFSVTNLVNNGTRMLISLRIPEEAAGTVTQAGSLGRITLVLVAQEEAN